MKPHALVVDDDPDILEDVKDRLESMGHTCDCVESQQAAQEQLSKRTYAYVLLDLEIPVQYGRKPRVQNGLNLLHEIRAMPGGDALPVLVMTGHGLDGPDLAVEVMRDGRATDFVKKPFPPRGNTLEKRIAEALRRAASGTGGGKAQEAPPAPEAGKLTPFKEAPRTMVIFEDRIMLCGREVWNDRAQPELRDIILRLKERNEHGYVTIRATKLNKDLKRNPSNSVAKTIERFRSRATEVMAGLKLECGREDVIATQGGYHLTDWIVVREAGMDETSETNGLIGGETCLTSGLTARETCLKTRETNETGETIRETSETKPTGKAAARPAADNWNERQRWVLDRLAAGDPLRFKDLRTAYPRRSRAALQRDLKELKDGGLVELDADGYYRSPPKARR